MEKPRGAKKRGARKSASGLYKATERVRRFQRPAKEKTKGVKNGPTNMENFMMAVPKSGTSKGLEEKGKYVECGGAELGRGPTDFVKSCCANKVLGVGIRVERAETPYDLPADTPGRCLEEPPGEETPINHTQKKQGA